MTYLSSSVEEVIPLTSNPSHGMTVGGGGGPPATIATTTTTTLAAATTTSAGQTSYLVDEFWYSADLIFQSRFVYLFALGPMAVVGDATGLLSPAMCFICSGLSLVPLAERLSFVTEQVAEHTNGTIGALLNATFGNAPELLISVAALRAGYYRVVQLAMLGSMFTNMILVFGISCLIGGLRWQVQELRTTSGNVNVVMLLLATAGSLFPSALIMTGQLGRDGIPPGGSIPKDLPPSEQEITYSRVNAAVIVTLYVCFLIFQLDTHREEFDDDDGKNDNNDLAMEQSPSRRGRRSTPRTGSINPRRRNVVCRRYMGIVHRFFTTTNSTAAHPRHYPHALDETKKWQKSDRNIKYKDGKKGLRAGDHELGLHDTMADDHEQQQQQQRRRRRTASTPHDDSSIESSTPDDARLSRHQHKLKDSLKFESDVDSTDAESDKPETAIISLRVGVCWLFIITLCISSITDVIVGTIDGFAERLQLSGVFTSMIIIPFFSNVAEQVSAFIFAYRNEMDLCVGVTVGSAIQIATFVLPGSVLIGWAMDRSMTLFFRGYETASLLFCVLVVGAVLQGGTTNWLVGVILIGVYIIFAAGIWFHELEELTVDAELRIGNYTRII